jgi:hypothetical protein
LSVAVAVVVKVMAAVVEEQEVIEQVLVCQ